MGTMMGIDLQVLDRGRPQTHMGKSVDDAMVAIERWPTQFVEPVKLHRAIRANLMGLGYGE